MNKIIRKSWRFNFLAQPEHYEEFYRWVDADTKEDAIKKLKENFYGYDLKQIIAIDIKNKEIA
jgi:hypothetical protein